MVVITFTVLLGSKADLTTLLEPTPPYFLAL